MLTLTQLVLFLLPTLLLNLTPGPDMLFVLSRGMARGRAAVLRAVAGMSVGYLFHVTLVSVGLASLLQSAPGLLTWVKILGAAYLAWMGIRVFTSSGAATHDISPATPSSDFRQGIVVSASNPKVAIYFLAYLPQFVNPAHGNARLQLATLGVLFIVSSALVNGSVGLLSGTLGRWLRTSARGPMLIDRVCGTVMIGLAARLVS